MKKDREFIELGNCSITSSTNLYLSYCIEGGVFKGFYLAKQYSIKDSTNPDKEVMVFAKGAYRVDTIEQLEKLKDVIEEGIKKYKKKEKSNESNKKESK